MERWLSAISTRLPEASVTSLDGSEDPETVVAALVWKPPPGSLRPFLNLRLVHSFGHGVDALIADATLPDVAIARLVDPELARAIARYVLHAALHHIQDVDAFRGLQAESEWRGLRPRFVSRFPVTVLGFGALGAEVARLAAAAGFPVRVWSRTERTSPHPASSGPAGLIEALDGAGIVVNVLPLTPETQNLCSEEFFERFRGDDTLFINVGRGATVDEEALLRALDAGRVGHAVLDVTRDEPLPVANPLWAHPRVTITPHVSGPTSIDSAADILAANLRRALNGEPPENLVDRTRGY
jgi:glyoxylate/hydroxypyruvate reductase A